MKRVLDVVLTSVALVVLALPLLVVMGLVRWKLGGPVFFRQTRAGLDGKPFEVIKFRTMTDERGPDGELLPDAQRITPFGWMIRRTSIDELPELWCVLKGEMSLVGPRPLPTFYLPLYSPEQARRLLVLPGITGWAQVNGRNSLSWEEKFRLDVWYVDHQSFWLDLRILWRTIGTVLAKEDISAAGEVSATASAGARRRHRRHGRRGPHRKPWGIANARYRILALAQLQPRRGAGSAARAALEPCQLLDRHRVPRLEKEFAAWCGAEYAVTLANGTLALDVALHALDIGPGDEVVVAPRTFLASVSCVVNAGAKPVFADVDPDSGNLSAHTIAAVLTPRTRAVICVHLAGMPCDMDPIMALAREHGFKVIEDCAQAHGAVYKGRMVGTIGHIGAWSFCQDKIMTTGGEGGMVTTDDRELWSHMWSYKDHGKSWEPCMARIRRASAGCTTPSAPTGA